MRSALLLCVSTLAAQPRLISYREVVPVLAECDRCHAPQKRIGFFAGSYAALMDGTFGGGRFRPALVPGSTDRSPLFRTHQNRVPQLLRAWIDAGAKPDETAREHRIDLDGVPVDEARGAFWLSCRAPKDGQDIALRVKVIDEATGNIVAYDWPTSSRDLNGRWNQWRIAIPKSAMKLPGTVSVRLHVSGGQDERELDGVIFVLEPKQTPDDELLKQKDLRTDPQPVVPPRQNMAFRYVLRVPSDVALSVRPEGGGAPVFRWSDRDLPAGRILETPWDFHAAPAVKTGWYTARFQCNSRNPGVFQPDMAILFRIVR
jgi:hypothetical protein